MSAMNRLTQQQINGLDWRTTNFKLESIAKNNSFLKKVMKSSPKQICNFLCAFDGNRVLEVLGVDVFSELLNTAKQSPKFKDVDFVAVLTTELQLPESFVFEYQNMVDIATMYTQKWCRPELTAKYAEDIDLISAILYNCDIYPKNNDFIPMAEPVVKEAVEQSYYGYCVSSLLLNDYGVKISPSAIDAKIRNTVIDLATIHKVGVKELIPFEGLTVDQCSYKMNTTKGQYGSLIQLVSYIRGIYNETQ